MADLFSARYNPDVLSCIANLSNDEVFTPPEVANAMLDMLPQELFESPDTKFLDPACKSGVFLREITKRLLKGLEGKIPDRQERIDHILHNQVYGIAITEMTSLLARRSLYCSKYPNCKYSVSQFDNIQGNVRFKNTPHRFKNGKCVFCGAKEEMFGSKAREGLEFHAYEFIHTIFPEEIWNMKFDVVIGNPPYQMSDGGSSTGNSAIPIYQYFVEKAQKLSPRYLSMIIPARWYAGGRALDEFRDNMLNDKHVRLLVDYPKSRDCFPGVDVAGGICYFLWERDRTGDCSVINVNQDKVNETVRDLNEFPIFIRDNIGVNIVRKVLSNCNCKMVSEVMPNYNPFLVRSFERGEKEYFENSIKLYSSGGIGFIDRSSIYKNVDLIPNYKVIMGKVNPDRGGVNNASDGKMNVITKINILGPNVVCSETYLSVGTYKTEKEADNLASFFRTKFARYLISITLSSMNITKTNFQFVPYLDVNEDWTDDKLYKLFNLNKEEINVIENSIRELPEGIKVYE